MWREVSAPGQVLSQQAIGALVRAALPGAGWVAEEHRHLQGGALELMLHHFRATDPRHASTHLFGQVPRGVDDTIGN